MVKIRVERKQNVIQMVEIKDHAGYADTGQDLVCAGISSIAVGMMNALDLLVSDVCSFQMKKAYIKIQLLQRNEKAELLLETMCIQFVTLKENYDTYISIQDQEV